LVADGDKFNSLFNDMKCPICKGQKVILESNPKRYMSHGKPVIREMGRYVPCTCVKQKKELKLLDKGRGKLLGGLIKQ
jgi:hypothetical protein